MTNDFAGDVVAQGLHESLNASSAELADIPASDADRVVMVAYSREAVPRGAVEEVQPAYNADFHEKLNRPEDGCSAHAGQLAAYLLNGKALLFPFEDANNSEPWGSGPVTPVFKDGHDVWA